LERISEKALRERMAKGILDLIVLRLLKAKPRWGYEINLAIRDEYKVYLSAGTLYPLLHSLEGNGYIEGSWESEGGRDRRIYKITQRGEELLAAGERASEDIFRRFQSKGQ
jgi:PadR family transcriptional regulator PadR